VSIPQSQNQRSSEVLINDPGTRFILAVLPPTRLLPIMVAVVCLWCGASWLWADAMCTKRVSQMLADEQGVAETNATTLSNNIGLGLAHLRSIPVILAKDPSLVSVLSQFGSDIGASALPLDSRRDMWLADPRFIGIARRLAELTHDVGVNQIWVMNAAGDCFVSGGFPASLTATGANFADRDYFRAAQQGPSGQQFAVGRTTDLPGLYYSSPILDGSRFLGVVTIKVELTDLAKLVVDPNVFVSDENGVIILAGDKSLIMRVVPGAKVGEMSAEELENRYKRTVFETVGLEPMNFAGQSNLVRWNGERIPYILAVRGRAEDIVTIHVLRGLWAIEDIRHGRFGWFISLSVTGSSLLLVLVGVVIFLRRNFEHGREMAMANADLAELNMKLEEQANTDALTGCANRRQFMAALELERRRSGRYATPFSLALLDLDRFKMINDRDGHAAGDGALRHFVAVAGDNLRMTDLLGRLGGDEFAILMPQTNLDAAAMLGERIHSALKTAPLLLADKEIFFGVSVGVAQWRAEDKEAVEELLARADAAMYKAKIAGRALADADRKNHPFGDGAAI
jgi:diguanylate cyclase (GGDEF)-like protein